MILRYFRVYHQILGAFGPKLRELELTGRHLDSVTLDAFEGIESYELLLTIRYVEKVAFFVLV